MVGYQGKGMEEMDHRYILYKGTSLFTFLCCVSCSPPSGWACRSSMGNWWRWWHPVPRISCNSFLPISLIMHPLQLLLFCMWVGSAAVCTACLFMFSWNCSIRVLAGRAECLRRGRQNFCKLPMSRWVLYVPRNLSVAWAEQTSEKKDLVLWRNTFEKQSYGWTWVWLSLLGWLTIANCLNVQLGLWDFGAIHWPSKSDHATQSNIIHGQPLCICIHPVSSISGVTPFPHLSHTIGEKNPKQKGNALCL